MNLAIIIPALNPGQPLLCLVDGLKRLHFRRIVVVDDGSDAKYALIFRRLEEMGCLLLRHLTNLGKGQAIKTAISALSKSTIPPEGYLTVDADGQHSVWDILKISEAMHAHPRQLILGVRDFKERGVPTRSRIGNTFSAWFFKINTGVSCLDTQTGLRGIPASLQGLALSTPGTRYEYEMNFLSQAAKEGVALVQIPIETIYNEKNAQSHFRPIMDSARIYATPLRFAAASLTCAGVDLLLFHIIVSVLSSAVFAVIPAATVAARMISGALNFLLNRKWSFGVGGNVRRQALRYGFVFVSQMLLSAVFVSSFAKLAPPTVVKILVDSALFILSYFVQRLWVFKPQQFSVRRRRP